MKFRNPIGIFLISIVFVACNSKTEFEEKNIDNEFSIELPTYMVELDLGIPEASLQYGHEINEHYVAVLRENPSDLAAIGVTDIETYADMYVSGVKLSVEDVVVERVGDGVEIQNGLQTVTYEAEGILPDNGLGIYYYMRFCKSKTSYYYVLDWTLTKFKDDHLSDMKRITNSIKEL